MATVERQLCQDSSVSVRPDQQAVAPQSPAACATLPTVSVIGTPCGCGTFEEVTRLLTEAAARPRPLLVDFTNTHVATLRRLDPDFRAATERVDLFLPDSQVLCLAARLLGGTAVVRHYGPSFFPRFLAATARYRHAFVGGGAGLAPALRAATPDLRIAHADHGLVEGREAEIAAALRGADADFVWLGLGTPKQQLFGARLAADLARGVILPVGYAFDVASGTKPDIPLILQRLGLGWAYRLACEPRRLAHRYLVLGAHFVRLLALQLAGRPVRRRHE